jgi:hypothetical protein
MIVNKLVYYKFDSVSWGHLERGDMSVFWFPDNPDKKLCQTHHRAAGRTVEMKNGIVYINGEECAKIISIPNTIRL